METDELILIYFFDERGPVRYHSLRKNVMKTNDYVRSKFGQFKYVNIYADGLYEGRIYNNQIIK